MSSSDASGARSSAAFPALLLVLAATLACTGERAAPPGSGGTHPRGIADPLSPDFHGASLRARRYAPMLDPADDEACGRCHAGTRSTPANISFTAPGATACTTCHTEKGGIFACATCHSKGESPPHQAHLEPGPAHASGFACSTCHPMPGPAVIGGQHGDGTVQVLFDSMLVAPGASFDPTTATCAVSCHARGGARPAPTWTAQTAFGCGDCHRSPPADHFPGACSGCHREADAAGTSLSGGPLHMNGRVDLGDGGSGCGACHGEGTDAWPLAGAHPSHRAPTIASPVDCASCHPVPSVTIAAGHLDGTVQVVFGGHAKDRGAAPAWNGSSCTDVGCHGAGLHIAPSVVPVWNDPSGKASACDGCHGAPPLQHTPSTQCGRSDCHSGEVKSDQGVLSITLSGRALHIDGTIEVTRP